VLDAACGTGRHGVELAGRGHHVIGVDRSPAMLAKAREKLPQGGARRRSHGLPVESGTVDAVVCALALGPSAGGCRRDGGICACGEARRAGIISDVHPFLIMLGWRAQFRTEGGAGFMRLNGHLLSNYSQAADAAGLRVRGIQELRLTQESAITVATERLPEANHANSVGLPSVVIWDLEKA